MRKFFGLRNKHGPAPTAPAREQDFAHHLNAPDSPVEPPSAQSRQVTFTAEAKGQPRVAVNTHADAVSAPRTAFPSHAEPASILRSISPLSVSSNASSFSHSLAMQYANDSESTFVRPPVTWAQMTVPDLVENLSDRERIRQEVLWEIVASEERYVQELMCMTELYVEPLLHPDRSPPTSASNSPSVSSNHHFGHFHHSPDPSEGHGPALEPLRKGQSVSSDHLPIAAKFSRTPSNASVRDLAPPNVGLGIENVPQPSKDSHARLMSEGNGQTLRARSGPSQPAPGFRSERSLPASFARQQQQSPPATFRHHLKSLSPQPHKLHKPKSARPAASDYPPLVLPDALKVLLDTIGESLVARHKTLSILLKERWQAQYPLVRNLAAVWVDQSWIVHDYRNYVLHLERGLEAVNDILATVGSPKSKKTGSGASDEERNTRRLSKLIMRLEEQAAMRGESGLAICLSKPFQRLLKYPLLFQNLLYHTDASTTEYESTRELAVELDAVVKSIENDKISEEERDRVHDLWARIEGVNDKALMAPRSDRFLLEERSLWEPPHARRSVSDAGNSSTLHAPPAEHKSKSQKTVRRLSDMLGATEKDKQPSFGSKRDVWLIHLSDVVLRCQRIGETALPINALLRNKEVKTKGRSAITPRKRNLYRFVRVERWEMRSPTAEDSEYGLIHMHDVSRVSSRAYSHPPVEEEEPQEEHNECDVQSRMSFSYADDDPTPLPDFAATSPGPRSFHFSSPTPLNRLSPNTRVTTTPSSSTQSATTRRGPSAAKFEKRLRPSQQPRSLSPNPQQTPHGYAAPTQAYLSKIHRPVTPSGQRANSTTGRLAAGRERVLQNSSNSSPESDDEPKTPTSGQEPERIGHVRTESGILLFNEYWSEQSK